MNQDCPLPPDSRIVAYARDSGGPRQESSVSQQVAEYARFCQKHKLILVRIFADEARSGRTTVGRDEFHAMMDWLQQDPRPVDGILVWDSSRSWRKLDDGQYYRASLRRWGYVFIYVTEYIPDSLQGRVIETLHDYSHEMYLIELGHAIKRGLGSLARRGFRWGVPPVGFTSEKVTIGKHRDGSPHVVSRWSPDPETWDRVCEAWQMRALGYTHKEIHEATRLFSCTQSYSKFFANPAYLGILKCGDLEIPDAWPAACTREQWDVVQAMRRPYLEGGAYPRRANSPYLLSGLAQCAYCGSPMSGSCTRYTRKDGTKVTWAYYVCGDKHRNGSYTCESKILKATMVEQSVLHVVVAKILTPSHIMSLVERVNEKLASGRNIVDTEIGGYTKRLAELDRIIANLADVAETDGFQAIKHRLAERETERRLIERELVRLGQHHIDKIEIDESDLRYTVAEVCATLTSENTKAAQKLLRRFMEKIILARDGGELHYRLPILLFPFGNQMLPLHNRLPITTIQFAYE